MVSKDLEDSIKKSAVLANKDPFFWNWNVVLIILKVLYNDLILWKAIKNLNFLQSQSDTLKKLDDSNQKLFIKRLVEFFKPSNNRFSQIKLGHSHSHLYTLVASELIDYLVDADEVSFHSISRVYIFDLIIFITGRSQQITGRVDRRHF